MPDQTECSKHIFIHYSVFLQSLDNEVFVSYEILFKKGIYLGTGISHTEVIIVNKSRYFRKFTYSTLLFITLSKCLKRSELLLLERLE